MKTDTTKYSIYIRGTLLDFSNIDYCIEPLNKCYFCNQSGNLKYDIRYNDNYTMTVYPVCAKDVKLLRKTCTDMRIISRYKLERILFKSFLCTLQNMFDDLFQHLNIKEKDFLSINNIITKSFNESVIKEIIK